MNGNQENTFTSTSSNSENNNLAMRLKLPTISWSWGKTNQQQTTRDKIGVKEQEKEEGNKLLNLQGRLHQEADKIKQWKLQTETQLKQKEKTISDSTQTIENLRKTILEIQIQNENITLELQEELSNKEELLQKVDSTRELCNVVKEHVQTLENKTIQCEATCNEVKYQEREHFEKYTDLSLQFQNLDISATEEQNRLKSEVTKYSSEIEDLGKCLEKSAMDVERQNTVYVENFSQKESHLKAITEKLNDDEKQVAQQKEMIVHLCSNVQDLKDGIENKENRIEQLLKEANSLNKAKCQLSTEYQKVQLCISEIEQSHKSLKNEMSEQSSQYSHKLETLQLELRDAKERYEKLKKMHQELNTEQANSIKLIETLKSDKDILILEKENLDSSLKNEINSKNELQTILGKENDEIKNLNKCILELNDKLCVTKTEHSENQLELNNNKKLFDDLQSNFVQLRKEKELLEKELDTKTAEHVHLGDKLKFIEKSSELKIGQNDKNLVEIKHQNSQLTKNLSDMKMEMKLKEEKYQNHIKELEKDKLDSNDTIHKYKSEQDQVQSQIKDFKEHIHQLQKELKQYKKEKEKLLIDKQTFEDMTKQKEAAEKETKQTIDNCEIQRQEMMSTLEKYKQENEKVLNIKEKEIETICTKNELQNKELQNKFKNDLKEKTDEWVKENQELKGEISELSREIAILKSENSDLQIKIDKADASKEIVKPLSNDIPNKTPIFFFRKTPQRTVLVSPQEVVQNTPLLKAKSKLPQKRKVIFDPEKASFMSDTDSSVSEYAPLYCEYVRESNGIQQPCVSHGKENIPKKVQENFPQSKNQLKVVNELKKKDINANFSSKEIREEVQTKKKKPVKETSTPNVKKKIQSISKSPQKTSKNKKSKEATFWFDTDSIFGFGIDD